MYSNNIMSHEQRSTCVEPPLDQHFIVLYTVMHVQISNECTINVL